MLRAVGNSDVTRKPLLNLLSLWGAYYPEPKTSIVLIGKHTEIHENFR